MKQNLIIRASAGTGKTFSLATRFIRLMLLQGVSPERIVALTFSRAAAQEIYMKLLDRLWSAALSVAGAEKERCMLLQGLGAADLASVEQLNVDWSPNRFARILKDVIATQHHGTIATLDSFILKIVRSFPLEMGFQNAVDVLDGFAERQALTESRMALLASEDTSGDFGRAFKSATKGEFVRTCSKVLGKSLAGWRDFLLGHPECRTWTTSSMCGALGVEENPQKPNVDILPVTGKSGDPFGAVVKALEGDVGETPVFPDNKGGELMQYLMKHPDETSYTYQTKGGNSKTIDCGSHAVAEAIRAVVRYLLAKRVGRALDVVAAKLALCQMIEREYDVSTRKRGLLTFSDFTDCQALAETNEESALRLENLQFRFDSRFDHWALDEFQDTSQLQWLCLRRLVHEAAQPDAGRSVMAVGDLKQSIYTWRGGNDAPFKEMMDQWREFRGDQGEIVPNDISYRYEKNTADFINAVFGPTNVKVGELLGDDVQPAIARWQEEDCWMMHRPDRKDGREKSDDYVEIIAVNPPSTAEMGGAQDADADEEESGSAAMKVLAPRICACVAELWEQHEKEQSTDSIGILVRNNKDGQALAEHLRGWGETGLPVVWEGADGVLDAPLVRAVLELLKLAEHPEDTFAWKTVDVLFPIREIVFPELTHVGRVSREIAKKLTCFGLARTLKEIVAKITSSALRPDARSVLRLEALVREGVNYERRRDAACGVLHFIDYLAATVGRESSTSPHVIRILTIHRSKGLTLDHVIVPILEKGQTDTIVKPRRGTPLAGEGWALDTLPEVEAMLLPETAKAWRLAANERVLEQLRLNYVALTRARKSTHVFVCSDAHGNKVQFRDLLLAPFRKQGQAPLQDGVVCSLGQMPRWGRKAQPTTTSAPWRHKAGNSCVLRKAPSSDGGTHRAGHGFPVGMLFEQNGPTASERGTQAHANYAQIAWIDPLAPQSDMEAWIVKSPWCEAFVKTPEMTTLWRERSYERYEDGVWESGQFDRVVFFGKNGTRSAIIYDFKTNVRREGESASAFTSRLCDLYAGQMRSYRHALAALTGIPLERVFARLLLTATGSVAASPMFDDAVEPPIPRQ